MRMPFVICLGLLFESIMLRRVGATKRESLPEEVLASMRAMSQSVAEENHLKPEIR